MKRTISLIIAIAVMVSMFIVPVSADVLTSAADLATAGEWTLEGDLAIGGEVTLADTSDAYVIDLNGYTIAGRIKIAAGCDVTIKDSSAEKTGTINSIGIDDAIDIEGSTVVLDGITVIGAAGSGDAVFVRSGDVTIKNCTLAGGKAGLDSTSDAATVVVENTTFADYEVISGGQLEDARNCAIELRGNTSVKLAGANQFDVATIICRSNTHTASFAESFTYGDNASATFSENVDLGAGSGNPYLATTITYTYEAPATPTPETTPEATATAEPTVEPTTEPTTEPTSEPTTEPTTEPTVEPTTAPTTAPAEPTNEVAVPVEDVEFDIAAMGGTADFNPHGYGDKIGLMFGYGNVKSLGVRDLSKYSKIIITYATHHPFENKYEGMPCNSMFAICTNGTTVGYANVDKREEAGILAQQDTTNSTGAWANGERTCEIDLTNVDYNGEVFLSHYNSTGMEALVTKIVLVAAEGATTVVPGGSTDSGNTNNGNSNPNTGNFMPFVIVVAAAAFVVTVVSKKRAF